LCCALKTRWQQFGQFLNDFLKDFESDFLYEKLNFLCENLNFLYENLISFLQTSQIFCTKNLNDFLYDFLHDS